MSSISLGYGNKKFTLNLDSLHVQEIVTANKLDIPLFTPEDTVKAALANPVESAPLPDLVFRGDKICVIVPDITRVYESPFVTVPLVLEQILTGGVAREDITILTATGTHRPMTAQEHIQLLGEDVVKNYRIVDHQCSDQANMLEIGKTSHGTPVWLNRIAVDADKIVTVCGVVYHFLAGFGGGGKMLVPGIAARQTIQANHELALNPGLGNGRNPEVRSGNFTPSNPFHADIYEAASMMPPIFSLNVVPGSNSQIIRAYAGDWRKAHFKACELTRALEGTPIEKRAPFVIASASGAPKDINIYQGVKLLANAMQAAEPGAMIILLLACPEGFGNEDTRRLVCDFDNMKDRERELRRDFSIGAFVGYLLAETTEKYDIILVTDMAAENFKNTRLTAVKTLDDAMAIAKTNKNYAGPCIIMPEGASTFPMADQQ